VDVVIYARKIGRYVEGESNRKYKEWCYELKSLGLDERTTLVYE